MGCVRYPPKILLLKWRLTSLSFSKNEKNCSKTQRKTERLNTVPERDETRRERASLTQRVDSICKKYALVDHEIQTALVICFFPSDCLCLAAEKMQEVLSLWCLIVCGNMQKARRLRGRVSVEIRRTKCSIGSEKGEIILSSFPSRPYYHFISRIHVLPCFKNILPTL